MASAVTLTAEDFGTLTNGQGRSVSVQKFTWQTVAGLKLSVLNLDAAIIELCAPDRTWTSSANVLLGVERLEEYLQLDPTLICAAHFEKGWPLLAGNGVRSDALGGQPVDLNRVWHSFVDDTRLHLSLVRKSLAKHQSTYATVTISVEPSNVVRIQYQTCGTNDEMFRLAHRFLFNLGGCNAGAQATFEHVVQLNADSYVDENRNLRTAAENLADLRIAQHLGLSLYKARNQGLERAESIQGIYGLNNTAEDGFAMRLIHTGSGRAMELYCNFPWLHLSILDHLPAGKDAIVPFYPREGIQRVSLVYDLQELILSVVGGTELASTDDVQQDNNADVNHDRQQHHSTAYLGKYVKHDGFLIHPLACPSRSTGNHNPTPVSPDTQLPNPCRGQTPMPFIGHVTLKFGICKPLTAEENAQSPPASN
ncbi:uncharacterized protein LOC128715316 [Anopheles marshallii]|uniref:uncharacterized protein LOC128715316 n=1 Tax=Anopheles marshallii TaxID=1521116 RepID=UPI00237ABFB2|nr:uncharacterized protein LOC128715316 [Anopheles marshallii]